MARTSEHPTEAIYDAGRRFLERCLEGDDSLISEEWHLWSLANLQAILKVLKESPDEGDRSFTDKLEDQLKPMDADIKRLGAEILGFYLLFPSNVGSDWKRELVGKVLGWADEQLPEDSVLGKALASRGVGSGGQGYSTRRYFEIVFLIEFAIHWKLLPQEIRASAASDPWAFLEVVKKIDGADSRQMRHCSRTLFSPINSSASPAEITSSE